MFDAIDMPVTFLGSRHSDIAADNTNQQHAHDFYELNFLTSGKTRMKLNERTIDYDSYDFVLIPPQMLHILHWSEYSKFDNYVIWLRIESPIEIFDSDHAIKLHDYSGAVRFLCSEIYRMNQTSGMEQIDLINAYLYAVLLHMRNGLSMGTKQRDIREDQIESAVQFINLNIMSKPVTVSMAAHEVGLSLSYFTRLFHKKIGTTPSKYISEVKIAHAKRLLGESTAPIQEISAQLHYEDPLYFSRQFSKLVGMSPTQFRNHLAPNSKMSK